MQVQVNGKPRSLDQENIKIESLLGILDVESPDMVSVQLNGDIVPKESYGTMEVKNGDELEFLYFMGGG